MKNLKEDVFHYVWITKNFNVKALKTIDRRDLFIRKFGHHNHDAGPDFLESEIVIDNQSWFGNIEIHTKASDWYRHKHHNDPNYNSVILHVSYIHDKDIVNQAGHKIPAIELKPYLNKHVMKNYATFNDKASFVPCEELIHRIDNTEIELFKEDLLIDRIRSKTKTIDRIFSETKKDWQETWYRFIMRSLGSQINQDAFESTAIALPYKILLKHRNNPMQVYAFLFGQSGFLQSPLDDFTKQLTKEYQFLSKKYDLKPLPITVWKFARMRPAAFPPLRLAAFAEWVIKEGDFYQGFSQCNQIREVSDMLQVKLHPYWDNHYRLGKVASKVYQKKLSPTFINNMLINAFIPFRFYKAKWLNQPEIQIAVVEMLRELKPEINKIMKQWSKIGMINDSAFDSQALLHLNKNYCNLKACLKCKIGHKLLNNKP